MNALLLILATIPPYTDGVPATYPEDVYAAAVETYLLYSRSRGVIDKALQENPALDVDREVLSRLYAEAGKMEYQHRPLMEPDILPDGSRRLSEDPPFHPLWRPVIKNGKQVYVLDYTGGPLESRTAWLWTHDSDPRACWRAAVALKKIADEVSQGGAR
jgi:hypothetical protein